MIRMYFWEKWEKVGVDKILTIINVPGECMLYSDILYRFLSKIYSNYLNCEI